MKHLADRITRRVYTALNFLFLRNPERSALGVCVGVCLHLLTQIFQPTLEQIQGVSLSGIAIWQYVILGVTLLHLPTILRRSLFSSDLDENTERALAVIRKAKEAGISDWHLRRMYLELCERALQNTVINEQIRREIDEGDNKQ